MGADAGYIGVVDADTVERSNLARQVLHTDARVGMSKAESVAQALEAYAARSYTSRQLKSSCTC